MTREQAELRAQFAADETGFAMAIHRTIEDQNEWNWCRLECVGQQEHVVLYPADRFDIIQDWLKYANAEFIEQTENEDERTQTLYYVVADKPLIVLRKLHKEGLRLTPEFFVFTALTGERAHHIREQLEQYVLTDKKGL